ncbi:unnamed protein product [Ostreobium quekettii]|uniref:Uncharacterized protein n=1 Tax=Ostreobium quekettii TaxID=121088 RepID=A0A8S1JIS3_9CHLO|nr:unnamed protein product [Ostreobium quekettii]|eukprot:evm.model.scf_1053EXC.6 EVM.evm.TU.scf_1053EXC.6   scf_1053EXC:30607-32887(-)
MPPSAGAPLQPDTVLRGHGSPVQCASLHPSGRLLASGDAAGVVKVWDLHHRRPAASFQPHPTPFGVLSLAVVDRHGLASIVTQGRDGKVEMWALGPDGSVGEGSGGGVETGAYGMCGVAVMGVDNGVVMATPCGEPGRVEVVDLEAGKQVASLRSAQGDEKWGMVMAVDLYRKSGGDDLGVAVGYEDGSVGLWDLRFPSDPLVRLKLFDEPTLSLTIDVEGKGGVAGGATKQVAMLSLKDGEPTKALRLRKLVGVKEEGINCVAIRTDRRVFATGGWDGKARVWNYKRGVPLAVLKYHTKEVAGVAYLPGGSLLATASRDTTVALWSVFAETGPN